MKEERLIKYLIEKDKKNPFSDLYRLEEGELFYVEPAFYTALEGFKERHPKDYDKIIDEMIRIVKRNKKVVFTINFENPLTEAEGFIYLEITDITNPLHLFVEDKSRGSDYGD